MQAPEILGGEAKLFVGGLPLEAGDDEIRHTFAPFGELTEIYLLPNHSRTGQRCAFVKFSDWGRCANAWSTGSAAIRYHSSTRGGCNGYP